MNKKIKFCIDLWLLNFKELDGGVCKYILSKKRKYPLLLLEPFLNSNQNVQFI